MLVSIPSPTLDLSVVVPLFNEEESLPELVSWIERVVNNQGITYEVILVDDGSNDNSWTVVEKLSSSNPNVKGIRFNRNYGKSAALNVGFHQTKGKVVITMDADLQDSPDEILGLMRRINEEGYDLISGWKQKRFDPISKTIPSKLFNAVTRYMSGIQLNDFNCGLKAYRHKVVHSIEVHGEMHRYIPVISKWNGFGRIGEQIVEHRARKYGVTKFGLERFIYGFLDLLSIMFVSRFRKRPMHFFGALGSLFFFIGLTITGYLIGEKLYHNLILGTAARNVTDQGLFFLALFAAGVGVQLFLAGFLGEMIAQANHRRNEYLIAETAGDLHIQD